MTKLVFQQAKLQVIKVRNPKKAIKNGIKNNKKKGNI